ncbi:hypothetical protein Tco_0051425 [Tanacetum coccineum]
MDNVKETAKVDEDKETVELQSLIEVIHDEEEVAVDAIPLATKPPSIMLKSFDREDLETLWKLVKANHGSTRPEEGYERVLWGDLKTMFEHHVEDTGRIVGIKRLLDDLEVTAAKVRVTAAKQNLVLFSFLNEKYAKVDITAKTRRPQPSTNTKNDRVPYVSKSSCIKNKDVEVEEHPRNLLLSKNKKHMSSECNNIQLAIRMDKSEVVCAMCKQCLITANHDVYVLKYVNDINSGGDKHNDNVSKIAYQKKHQTKVKKPKKVESKERLVSPKPRKPRTCLRWSPTGRLFDLKGKLIASSKFECQSDCSKIENACTSNHQEPTSKWFPNSTFSLAGTIRFGNDHIAAILGYGDLQWGNILITKVYFIKGLGHNLFSVGQFCDSDLEVAFRRNTCFVRNLEGVDLLKGNRTTNLYTINLHEMAAASQFASWLVLLLPSLGYGINVYPTSILTS